MFKSLSANLNSLKLFYNTEGQKSILHSQENTLQSYFGFQTYLATPNQFTEDVDFSSDGHFFGSFLQLLTYFKEILFFFQTYLATPNQFTEDVDFSSDGHFFGSFLQLLTYFKEILFFFQTYLATPNQFTEDVDFSSDGQHIIGARFMIQGAHIYDTNQEQIFVEELRAVCHNSQFNVTVFHPFFIFFDQVSY